MRIGRLYIGIEPKPVEPPPDYAIIEHLEITKSGKIELKASGQAASDITNAIAELWDLNGGTNFLMQTGWSPNHGSFQITVRKIYAPTPEIIAVDYARALERIADGDGNPQQIATEVLTKFGRRKDKEEEESE